MSNSAKKQHVMLHSAKRYAVRLVWVGMTATLLIGLNAYATENTLGGDPKHASITAPKMALIPAGTFCMGSPESEVERYDDETQHKVTISKDFWMSQYEVTQAEWEAVIGNNPSYSQGANLPVEQVSWYDAIEYCNKLSEKEGLTPAYRIDKGRNDPNNENKHDVVRWLVTWDREANGYRLPTEAEWEYACRAGTTTPFSTGNNLTTNQANYNGNYPYNENAEGEYQERTTAAGSFPPNAWGIYDMHGNVWEWCWDWYDDYSENNQIDPSGAASGTGRVLRSGCWGSGGRGVRSANRGSLTPDHWYDVYGFRLVRPL